MSLYYLTKIVNKLVKDVRWLKGNLTNLEEEVASSGYTDSASLLADITDETGTGLAVFNDTPTIKNPVMDVNTTAKAAITFTNSGNNLKTTSAAGDLEIGSGNRLYYSHAASERGIIPVEQFISSTSQNILVSQTALQKIFASPTNGAITLSANTSYFFECAFDISAMSSTSGTFSFGFLGTATFTSLKFTSIAGKSSGTVGSNITFATSAGGTVITSSTVQTAGSAIISGIIRTNVSGTLIPAVGFSTVAGPATPVISANAYFKINTIGTDTVVSSGNWS